MYACHLNSCLSSYNEMKYSESPGSGEIGPLGATSFIIISLTQVTSSGIIDSLSHRLCNIIGGVRSLDTNYEIRSSGCKAIIPNTMCHLTLPSTN